MQSIFISRLTQVSLRFYQLICTVRLDRVLKSNWTLEYSGWVCLKLNGTGFQSYTFFFLPQVGSVEYWNSVFWMQVTVSSPLSSYPSLQLRDRTVPVETGNCLLAFMLVQVVFRLVQSEIVTFSKKLPDTITVTST